MMPAARGRGGAAHDPGFGRLSSKGQGGEGLGSEVDGEDL
jgi:hypothetical protein